MCIRFEVNLERIDAFPRYQTCSQGHLWWIWMLSKRRKAPGYTCVVCVGRIWLFVIHLMILDLRCIPNSDSLTLWRSKCMHSHPWPRWQTRLLQPKDQPTSATRGSPNHDLCKLSTRSSQKHTVVRWIPIWSTVDQKTCQKWPHLWDLWVFNKVHWTFNFTIPTANIDGKVPATSDSIVAILFSVASPRRPPNATIGARQAK